MMSMFCSLSQFFPTILSRAKISPSSTLFHTLFSGPLKSSTVESVISLIEDLLKIHAPLNTKDKEGFTSIHLAIKHNFDPKIIEHIYKAGPQNMLRTPNAAGRTALHTAVCNNNEKMVNFVLSKNPELVNVQDEKGKV